MYTSSQTCQISMLSYQNIHTGGKMADQTHVSGIKLTTNLLLANKEPTRFICS